MSSGILRRKGMLASGGICAVFSLVWVVLYWLGEATVSENFISPLTATELRTQDFRTRHGKPAKTDPRIVFLGFDQQVEDRPFEDEIAASKTLQLMNKNWPWSRAVWADAIQRLARAGAKAIVIDLLFPNPGTGDDALQRALYEHADKIVLGYNMANNVAATGSGNRAVSIYPSPTVIRSIV